MTKLWRNECAAPRKYPGCRREEDVRGDRVPGTRQHVLRVIGDRLMLRVGPDGYETALSASREKDGFHREADERAGLRRARGYASPRDLKAWIERAMRFALSLPRSSSRRAGRQYDTRQRKRPWAGALTPAAERSNARRISPTRPADASPSRVHHGPDDVAHHVAKKSRAGHVDGEQTRDVVICHLRPEDRADRRPRRAPLPAERAEIVLPDQVREAFPHRTQVQRRLDVPRVGGEERRTDRGKVQEVPVLLLRRVAPRVERFRDRFRGEDPDAPGRRAFPPRTIVSRSRLPESAKSATCSRAWTPASVRPAARRRTGSCRIRPSASSITDWIVVPFGCICHPAYAVPAYATVSLTRRIGCIPRK